MLRNSQGYSSQQAPFFFLHLHNCGVHQPLRRLLRETERGHSPGCGRREAALWSSLRARMWTSRELCQNKTDALMTSFTEEHFVKYKKTATARSERYRTTITFKKKTELSSFFKTNCKTKRHLMNFDAISM